MISSIPKACSVPWFPNKPLTMQYCSKLSLPSQHAMNPGRWVNIKDWVTCIMPHVSEIYSRFQITFILKYRKTIWLLHVFSDLMKFWMVSYSVHVWKSLIVAGDTRQQQRLLGAYSFASSGFIDLNQRGLSQSGTWNYLREEITTTLELRRLVRISTGFEFVLSENASDDMWSNYVSYILSKVINFCFAGAGV
jgi:hypothetical protein